MKQILTLSTLHLYTVVLELSYNALTGTLPSELATLPQVQRISLSANKIEGRIPTDWGNLETLKRLDLGSNSLTGPLPVELAKLDQLEYLHIAENQLTGTLPKELFTQWVEMKEFLFHFNAFTGILPTEVGTSSSKITHLDASGCLFMSGPIPSEIGQLKQLGMF
jgi:Leucine-rich repeat (LRR) protein